MMKRRERTLKVVNRWKSWDLPFDEAFDLLGSRFRRTGNWIQENEKTLRKWMGSWWVGCHLQREGQVSGQDMRQSGLCMGV